MNKTIKADEFNRLQFCNSKDLPARVNIAGRCKEWVGIGWVDIGPESAYAVTVVK